MYISSCLLDGSFVKLFKLGSQLDIINLLLSHQFLQGIQTTIRHLFFHCHLRVLLAELFENITRLFLKQVVLFLCNVSLICPLNSLSAQNSILNF